MGTIGWQIGVLETAGLLAQQASYWLHGSAKV
jgi:hypothetical protein